MSESTIQVTPLHVAGEAVAGGETLEVRSPFDQQHVGTVPVVGADAARAAVDAAAAAMAAGLPSHERAAILDRAAAIMRDRRQELARTLALEAGKPITQALVEVDRAVQTVTFSAVEARTLAGRAELVDVLVADPRVAMLTFTGSSEVGWGLAARAPRKHVALELGNSTPLIVCADADLDAAAQTTAASAFNFAGQSCISVQRVIVHASVHDAFLDELAAATRSKRVGDPLEADTSVGPLIDAAALRRVAEWVDEATAAGSRRVIGDGVRGSCLAPVVLDEVGTTAKVWRDEVFGPVVSVRSFEDVDEAFDLANDTEYGLQAGIYTRDLRVALTAAERLRFGGVTINETPTFRVDQMPYGGTKESGNTREGPHFTVREMTEERMVVVGG